MDHTAKDYKQLYELMLTEQQKSLALLTEKDLQIAALSFELDKFRRYLFGKTSEKLPSLQTDAAQIDLFELGVSQPEQQALSEQLPPESAQEEAAPEKKPAKKRAKGAGRMLLPENLRREIIFIEPAEDISGCVVIGEQVTEVLDLIPAEFYVKRYVRRKYVRPSGEGVLIGTLPDRVIDKGIPSEALLALMLLDKFVFGLPLHRQIDKYRRMGVSIPASTASDWLLQGWAYLKPLWELLKLLIQHQKYLQVDESPLKVLDRNHKQGIHQGYMWVYHAPCQGLVLFDYCKGRDRSGPQQILEGYSGILQSDGYGVYESLYGNHAQVMLIYCMAHARRKFVEALKDDEARASYVLGRLQQLYLLEEEMRQQQMDWQQRTEVRGEKALPVLRELGAWMLKEAPLLRPTSPLGKAVAYALPRWQGLSAYALHGQVEIDNNLVENAIRPLAIGRKNYLFAGSHQAAEMAAGIYSFMACCKKNGVDEYEWLNDVFERLQSHPRKDLYQLLPNNWKQYRPGLTP